MNHKQVLSTDSFLAAPQADDNAAKQDGTEVFPGVSRILRYEHLEEDMRKLLLELGVPPQALPPATAKATSSDQSSSSASWLPSWSESVLNRVGKKLLHSSTSFDFSDKRCVRGSRL